VCGHCGTERDAPLLSDRLEWLGDTPTRCPACASALRAATLEGYALLACPRCAGMLVEMPSFAAVIDAVRADAVSSPRAVPPRRQQPGERGMRCPACGQPMISHLYGGPGNIVIDTCERCLVNWLDAGELRRAATAPDARVDD
jgi:Zn-finger nucleic acid-binding protein